MTRLEDSEQYKNAFEISAPMIDKRVAVCQSKEEADHWVELLRKQMPRTSTVSTTSQKALPSQAQLVPQPPPHVSVSCICISILVLGPIKNYLELYINVILNVH